MSKADAYDFKALGKAIKKAREDKGWTREQVAEILHLVPRYIQSIENEGQHPSFQAFYNLVTLFHISVDEYLFPDKTTAKSTLRFQIDTMLDGFEEKDLIVIEGTIKGICKASLILSISMGFLTSTKFRRQLSFDCRH